MTSEGPASLAVTLRYRPAPAASAPPAAGFVLDVAFTLPPGISILFGPSGAGKSTLLAALAGLVRPAAGRIALGDEVWFSAASGIDRPAHRRSVGFVFQSLALFPHLSALDNVTYGIDPRLGRAERRHRALAMLERMHVSHVASRRPTTLSGGEAQRVALARALARAPRVLLLDEPFTALQRELRRDLGADLLAYVRDAPLPVLLVTHDAEEARTLGQRILHLEAGRLRAEGPATTLLKDGAP
ncbi:MAG TPA: ATP-binding cassette domain-containing protein [Polyangia bacterium]|jgi:molybdate transport system ATP-binding protein|nr:ATP-binding cassette domain-containing protein [Polyangia bacterium]